MAFIQCEFFSNVLGMQMQMNVILPQPNTAHIGTASAAKSATGDYPVMYLLHGMSDDQSIWSRFTGIERYVSGKNLIVVMPNAHRSYYMKMYRGFDYWTYISEELPEIVAGLFHVSKRREDTFVCGLSMGGYGALRLGLMRPDRFAAACSLSGVADIKSFPSYVDAGCRPEMERIFGPFDSLPESHDDLFYLADRFVASGGDTRILQVCGTEDFLYRDNVRLRDHFRKIGLKADYLEEPGSHTWEFWDRHVQTALGFFGF
ncbi:MAG: alpha/beta hydrolase family protein [Victivallaceae bacterium]|nr:alpha/beta hydrolase family protein [Victivallaceae bacterium]